MSRCQCRPDADQRQPLLGKSGRAGAQALGVKRIGCTMDGTSRAAVREPQKAGLRVTGWPGHSLQDYYLAVGLGVDAFCTDIPVAISTWKAQCEQK